jgi:4-amino-4-deoxy-L-arabinose transferase-like glycosyltransferase
MKLDKHHYFYLFAGFLFLGIVSIKLLSDGMFLDGLLYADISRNMAQGIGSFWKPHLSNCLFSEFYEHPPLAFGLQSLGFRLFGDSIYVERIYSLFTFIVVGYLIVLIWGKLTDDLKNGWIPLIFWIVVNNVTWAATNNMLENTMSIFVCLSMLCYLNSFDTKPIIWVILSGLSLTLALLTKGPFCLYIWGVPFFMWIFLRKKNFLQMIIDSLILIACTLIPIVLLYVFIPDAQYNIQHYLDYQVMGSIKSVVTVNSRFTIIGKFLENIITSLIIGIIVIVVGRKKAVDKHLFIENKNTALMLIVTVLSGVLPIMVSMKQRDFYILTVYPFFAIAWAYYLYPLIKLGIDRISLESKGFKIFKRICFGIIIISIGITISRINKVSRDFQMIHDTKAVISIVGKNNTINICPSMFTYWSLHGYFSRYGNVSLEANETNKCKYYLSNNDCNKEILTENYDLVPIKTMDYKLYCLKNSKISAKSK